MNKIALVKRTRRTETSQYPEEKKSTEISLVVASERERAQLSEVMRFKRMVWKSQPKRVIAPYLKSLMLEITKSRSGHEKS